MKCTFIVQFIGMLLLHVFDQIVCVLLFSFSGDGLMRYVSRQPLEILPLLQIQGVFSVINVLVL